jgi:hypothetical protein
MQQGQVGPSPELDRYSKIEAAWVEAIALRVVELMRNGTAPTHGRLVDAATLAAELGVTRSWIYGHRDELGVVRLGTGTKPRLRFDVETTRQVLGHRDSSGVTASGVSDGRYPANRRARSRRQRQPAAGSILAARPRKTA